MAFKNPDNPIDVDVTAQMLNDRLTFQYSSIIQSNTGNDILQEVLDNETEQSDTQVEIGMNINGVYGSNATVDNITTLLSESYSLILPNRNNLTTGQEGVILYQNDPDYLSNLKDYYAQDIYNQNSRQRYPAKSLVGRFVSVTDLISLTGFWRSESDVTPATQENIVYGITTDPNQGNVTVHSSLRQREGYIGDGYGSTTPLTGDTILDNLNANLTVNGTIGTRNLVVSENIFTPSDARLKTNIQSLENNISAIKCIQPVMFDWKHKNTNREIGFIAQNVQTVYPMLVNTVKEKDDKILTVNYMGFIPILCGALREQQEMIETMQDEIKNLKKLLHKET